MTQSELEKLGSLTAKVEALERRTERLESMLTEVRDTVVSAGGSWKAMVAIGGLLMALTSIITGLVLKFWPGGH